MRRMRWDTREIEGDEENKVVMRGDKGDNKENKEFRGRDEGTGKAMRMKPK